MKGAWSRTRACHWEIKLLPLRLEFDRLGFSSRYAAIIEATDKLVAAGLIELVKRTNAGTVVRVLPVPEEEPEG